MPLNPIALENALKTVLSTVHTTRGDAANSIAAAYGQYAQAATFLAGVPVPLTPQISALGALLAAGFTAGTLEAAAMAFTNGLSAFWQGVVVSGAVTGTTIGCPGAATLSNTIPTAFSVPAPDGAAAATILSMQLHLATQTVTATVVTPTAPPVTSVVPIL